MAINPYLLCLMPLSQAVSWYSILHCVQSSQPLYPAVAGVSMFYCLWGFYNKYFVTPYEVGHFTMACLSYAALHRIHCVVATSLVWLNYVVPSYYVLWKWDARQVAEIVKKDTTSAAIQWAHVFRFYCVSNIGLWSLVLYKFVVLASA